MRLVAALMVVAYHYIAYPSGWDTPAEKIFKSAYLPSTYGFLGVNLFFLISGFVICLSCWGRSLGDFLTSRVIRLFPAFWFAVICTSVVLYFYPGPERSLSPSQILANLTMLQDPFGAPEADGVYWTLWIEMRFYLLFALVVWRGVDYRRVVTFCIVWAAASAAAVGMNSPALSNILIANNSWFFIGGIAFFLMWKFRPSVLLWAIVGLSFLAGQYFVIDNYHGHALYYHGGRAPVWPVLVLLALFYVLMAGVALGWFSRISWRWLPTAGALTYPLYLIHENIGWSITSRLQHKVPPAELVGSIVVGMLIVAWVVHRVVERPVSKWLRTGFRASFADIREFSTAAPAKSPDLPPAEPSPAAAPAVGAPTVPDPRGAAAPGIPERSYAEEVPGARS
ncbi:acyltransferase [Kitasatospora sp. NBC_01287]|uniref:acyltransferase family protein n=1 Tax=Kitasatospora sp. NBC_01287 TaxID=2903573 RepID=UPI002254414C|nr:acyltransferase [Kitasatospora sp. NBC_01287]MCX4747183.1 acyltransferase [Kitasatospora sp. NBC_01287]